MLNEIVQQHVSLLVEGLPKYKSLEYDVDRMTDAILRKVTPLLDKLISDLRSGIVKNRPQARGLFGHLKDWWREFIGLQNEATFEFYQVLNEYRGRFQSTPRSAQNVQYMLAQFKVSLLAALRAATKASLEKTLARYANTDQRNQEKFGNLLNRYKKRGEQKPGSTRAGRQSSKAGNSVTSTLDFQNVKGYPDYAPVSNPDSPEPTMPEPETDFEPPQDNWPYGSWLGNDGEEDYESVPEDPEPEDAEPAKTEPKVEPKLEPKVEPPKPVETPKEPTVATSPSPSQTQTSTVAPTAKKVKPKIKAAAPKPMTHQEIDDLFNGL